MCISRVRSPDGRGVPLGQHTVPQHQDVAVVLLMRDVIFNSISHVRRDVMVLLLLILLFLPPLVPVS